MLRSRGSFGAEALDLTTVAQVIDQLGELDLGTWICVCRDLKRQLLVPECETLF